MKTIVKIKPGILENVEVVARYLNIHSSTDEFIIRSDGVDSHVDSFDFIDFGLESEEGRHITFVNETNVDIDVEMSFSPFILHRRKRVDIGSTVPVSLVDGSVISVDNFPDFPGVQAVSLPSDLVLNVKSKSQDRVMSFGSVDIGADGLPVDLDFSGAYGFGFSLAAGMTWNGIDLSAGLVIAESDNKKMNASGQVAGLPGESLKFWRIG